jgi:NAD-dependent deacetylase
MAPEESSLKKLKSLIVQSSRIVIFTGAGMSTESGISDYRSQGGLWERYQPVTIQEFLADEEKRKEYWRRKKEMYLQMRDAKPNQGHEVIAKLEQDEKLLGVITQNIDGLHQKAGNKNVLELHGTNLEVICLGCSSLQPFEPVHKRLEAGDMIPLCKSCGNFLKPNTISFGQTLDQGVLQKSIEWSRECDLMIAIGSTLIVEPAASLPRIAKKSNACLAIINREPTPLDTLADIVMTDSIGKTLRAALSPLLNGN